MFETSRNLYKQCGRTNALKKGKIEKKEQAKEEDVLICARCGEQIIGDYQEELK